MDLSEINSRVDSGQIGMLTEIQVGTEWVNLKVFYKMEEARCRKTEPVSLSDTFSASQSSPAIMTDQSAVGVCKYRYNRIVSYSLVFLLVSIVATVWALNLQKAKTLTPTQNRLASRTNSQSNPVAVNLPAITNQMPSVTSLLTNQMVNRSVVNDTAVTPPTASNISVIVPILPVLPPEPPFPENENRTFHIINSTNIIGIIVGVYQKGIIIRKQDGTYTGQLPWPYFDQAAVAREPKVIAYRKTQEAARLTIEKNRQANEERARIKAEYYARLDAVIDKSIATYGHKVVTMGYLKAWGTDVTIGEIFRVVAPSAEWTATKLADNDPERYSHYIVEARWVNNKLENVAMQYLVTADGLNFHLHGCFVSHVKVPDATFLQTVKNIWNSEK
jgi:hypothetical protein